MTELHSRTYTPFPKPECNYIDGYGGTWIHISDQETKRTRKILSELNNKMFDASCADTADYLIDGCVVKTNSAHSSTPDHGWSFRLFSETREGLEEIAKKLRLPI
jgi:hypothetical protein